MNLSHDDVERILRLLDASDFDALHLELDGLKLDVRRRGAAAAPAGTGPAATPDAVPREEAGPPPTATPAASAGGTGAAAAGGLVEVRAPMLGTFYRAPKPGAEPFVAIGSHVEPDTVIGIIEVMKLMNSVNAGVRGDVVEIAAVDAQLVEYEQLLLRVRPA